MGVREKFKELVKALEPLLKGSGYKRQGQTFRVRRDDNWGVVFFQIGKWSNKTELEFTINLGVFSQAIDSFYREWGKESPPPEPACHWRSHLDFLLPERRGEYLRVINDSTELPDLIEELKAALPLCVAEIEKYLKDEDLRDYFLAGNCGGYTDQHRIKCLAVLVTEYGPHEKLASIFDEWRACPTYTIYEDVRQEIESNIKRLKQIADRKILQQRSAT
jgi:Domain of unknown function (DUF4304)